MCCCIQSSLLDRLHINDVQPSALQPSSLQPFSLTVINVDRAVVSRMLSMPHKLSMLTHAQHVELWGTTYKPVGAYTLETGTLGAYTVVPGRLRCHPAPLGLVQ